MIRSAALFYAVLVSLLVSTVLGAVLLLTHLKNMRTEQWLALNEARDAAMNGLMTCAVVSRPVEHRQVADTIRSSAWGLFTHCSCSAMRSDQRYALSALVGFRQTGIDRSLWLADHGDPLSLGGTTSILGTCHVPKAGVRRAYIEGKPLIGNGLSGISLTSDRALPLLAHSISTAFEVLDNSVERWAFDAVPRSVVPDSLRQPFDQEPVIVHLGSGPARIDRVNWSGHVVIMSEDSLRIGADAVLDGVLIIAPDIVIERGCTAAVQCFASQGITLLEGAELDYPSVLACRTADTAHVSGSITIESGCRFTGTIIGLRGRSSGDVNISVSLATGSSVVGELWNNGPTQLAGVFEGRVMTDQLFVRTASSVYFDHLLDAAISPLTDDELALPGIATEHGQPTIVQWTNPGAAWN